MAVHTLLLIRLMTCIDIGLEWLLLLQSVRVCINSAQALALGMETSTLLTCSSSLHSVQRECGPAPITSRLIILLIYTVFARVCMILVAMLAFFCLPSLCGVC